MSEPLSDDLRRALESTVKKARELAEEGARSALEALAVHRPEPFPHLDLDQRALRVRLRAHARQLGDPRDAKTGAHHIDRLVAQTAYEHWHRMLFARFLAENDLLMHPDGVAVTLDECDELAAEEGAADGWELACRYASRMLPQIFRPEAPELKVRLAPEHQRALEALVTGLDEAVFRASDSLGWVYQYWQARRKEEINASEVKIGADELPAVTQLFTEPYMVQFLLHNTLGAWWAGKVLVEHPTLATNAVDEDELRAACALPGYEWTFLRFIREEEGGAWRPAAGAFEGWPGKAAEITMLDPCCGSGHFLVEALQIIARLRMADEGLRPAEAVDVALRDNIHGLEIDERCTQIAAFALAFAAWTFSGASGFRMLPRMHVACSGLALASKKEEWLTLADEAASAGGMPVEKDLYRTQDSLMSSRLKADLSALYDLFKEAPTLGSLIDPRAMFGEMFQADFAALQSLLHGAMASEGHSEETVERAVVAQGLAEAGELLAAEFTVVLTNVPFLSRSKQAGRLREFCESKYPVAKADLATCLLERCVNFAGTEGAVAVVTPQTWHYLNSFSAMRKGLLDSSTWRFIAHLGPAAFRGMNWWAAKTALTVLSASRPPMGHTVSGIDLLEHRETGKKPRLVVQQSLRAIQQRRLSGYPLSVVTLHYLEEGERFSRFADCLQGVSTGDNDRFVRDHWEIPPCTSKWSLLQRSPTEHYDYSGCTGLIKLDGVECFSGSAIRGEAAWGRKGVVMKATGALACSLYNGEVFTNTSPVIIPKRPSDLPAIWCFCKSGALETELNKLNPNFKIDNGYVGNVSFDLSKWVGIACKELPQGLPQPESDDPRDARHCGHPARSNEPLQIAVARLLGYRYHPEVDGQMELASEALEWVGKTAELLPLADSDGIVCIPSVRGEEPGAARLRNLLAAAFGDQWSPSKLDQLLDQACYRGKGLERWLRDAFFEQHCKLFHHRPFVWQIWDGTKDGFSALVNYHKLDRALLETLIYSYLGGWIRRQEDAGRQGVSGAEERLAAARALQERLVLILKGEAPCDIFVRWKPVEEQPIGWNPDLDDGVRLNIRPFMTVPDVGRKGAGVLRWKPNIHWKKDRGSDPEGMPWYHLGPGYGGKPGDRINDHHLSLDEKRRARLEAGAKV